MGIFDKVFGDKSSVDRYVGGTDTSRKEMRKKAEQAFKNQPSLEGGIERPKTPEELEMIGLVNAETDRLREKYGLEDYRVPPENYHLVRREASGRDSATHFSLSRQEILVREDKNRNMLMKRLFHETVHFKSFASADVEKPGERRLGLTAAVQDEKEPYYVPLNEAVTEELTKRFMRKQERSPLLADEMSLLDRARQKYGSAKMEDIAAVDVEDIAGKPGSVRVETTAFSYVEERRALHVLIDKLKARNPKVFRDREEWFDLFASAMFNGHLLELARTIEGTFGKGKFRELGKQKTGKELLKFVESL
jgi:hypothetical protein